MTNPVPLFLDFVFLSSMANSYFQFKQFIIQQDHCAMKVTTDACFFGAWCAREIKNEKPANINLLDIGTGTGLLSLMVAQENTTLIDAIEIDKEAAMQAKKNVADSPWAERINLFNENILGLADNKKYDCIICNPPFYENELASSKKNKNIAHHSHKLKMQDVLIVIKQKLNADGKFFLLIPFKREAEIENMIYQQQLFINKKLVLKKVILFRFQCQANLYLRVFHF